MSIALSHDIVIPLYPKERTFAILRLLKMQVEMGRSFGHPHNATFLKRVRKSVHF